MEILLSTPVSIISGAIFGVIFVGVFLYELKNQRNQKDTPPPTHIPPEMISHIAPTPSEPPKVKLPTPPVAPKTQVATTQKSGGKRKIVVLAVILLLLGAVGSTTYLVGQRQTIFNFAQVAVPTPTSPLRQNALAVPSPTSGNSEVIGITPTLVVTKVPGATQSIVLPTSSTPPLTQALVQPGSSGADSPLCTKLTAEPASGKAPLKVLLTGQGTLSGGEIASMQFVFGDGNDKVIERSFGASASQQVIYTYSQNGIYRASVILKSSTGKLSETTESCVVTISVNTFTPTGTSVAKLPKTGAEATESATPIVKPKIPESGNPAPIVVAIVGGIIFIGVSIFAFLL